MERAAKAADVAWDRAQNGSPYAASGIASGGTLGPNLDVDQREAPPR
jgi:hypothetical protein